MIKLKYLIILTLLLIIIMVYILSSLSPVFKIINNTNDNIVYTNFQIEENRKDPTFEEMESYGVYYSADGTAKLFPHNLLNDKITLAITFYDDNSYEILGTVNFSQTPQNRMQKSYCGYNVEIVSNRKIIVTPTRKGWCIRPMYYHEL